MKPPPEVPAPNDYPFHGPAGAAERTLRVENGQLRRRVRDLEFAVEALQARLIAHRKLRGEDELAIGRAEGLLGNGSGGGR